MSFDRRVLGAWGVASGVLLVEALAFGASSLPTRSPHSGLPLGVHRQRTGVYTMDMCDHRAPIHCLAQRRLPDEYVPWVSELPKFGSGRRHPMAADASLPVADDAGPQVVPPPPGMTPTDIQRAYNLTDAPPGTGAIVGIIDAPDQYAASDLAAYRAAYGLPPLPNCPGNGLPVPGGTPCFASVDENGNLLTPTQIAAAQEDSPDGDGETGLDMDMVSAACPECSILLVQVTGNNQSGTGWADFQTAVQTAQKLGAVATSISFGGPEYTDPVFGDAGGLTDPTGWTIDGGLVFAASGDYGYDSEASCVGGQCGGDGGLVIPTTPSFPSSAPDIISVGGTIVTNVNGKYSETVWSYGQMQQDVTTSGCSSEFGPLAWQMSQTKLGTTTCKMRATADISAVASYTTVPGASPYVADGATNADFAPDGAIEYAPDGAVLYFGPVDIMSYSSFVIPGDPADSYVGWGGVEGTSAASPLVAAVFARLGLAQTVSTNLGWPYFNQTAFNDITSGTDDVDDQCLQSLLCAAGPGWDGPTGVGTPNGTKLMAALGIKPLVTDAGGDGGGDGGVVATHSTASKSSGCSCDTAGSTNGASGFGAAGLLVGLATLASRRRRSR